MEFSSTPFDRFDPFDSLALKPECWCNKTPFDHLTRLCRMEFNSTPFDRFDPFDSLALKPECWCNKTPFDHLTRLSRMESTRLHLIDLIHSTHLLYDLSAQATRHHLTIWQGLVEWSPFDSIWSIWSIRLTCFMVSQLRQQDTIWPFD